MNIKSKIELLHSFLQRMRRSGTTTLIQKITKDTDAWVLVSDASQKRHFDNRAVTFTDLYKMDCSKPKPVLVDNHTLITLCQEAMEEQGRTSNLIQDRNNLIQSIKQQIEDFENGRMELYRKDEVNIHWQLLNDLPRPKRNSKPRF